MTQVTEDADISISTYDGWKALAARGRRTKPALLNRTDLAGLSDQERRAYDESRAVWHANLGPYRTPGVIDAIEAIDTIVQSNRQDGHRVRTSAVLDANPGLGKTTVAVEYGVEFHRNHIATYGSTTAGGHDRIPVAYVGLTSDTTMRTLNAMLCRFYGYTAFGRGTAMELGLRASTAARLTGTRLIIIDDVHFLDPRRHDGREVTNHFKWLANEFSATFLFVGVGIVDRGLLSEGLGPHQAHHAQTARRWTMTTLEPFQCNSADSRQTWRRLMLAIEQDLVLADKTRGMLAVELADYLYVRSTGHFASLMALIARGCTKAIKTGEEKLSAQLLDTIRNDAASEQARGRAVPNRVNASGPRTVGRQ